MKQILCLYLFKFFFIKIPLKDWTILDITNQKPNKTFIQMPESLFLFLKEISAKDKRVLI